MSAVDSFNKGLDATAGEGGFETGAFAPNLLDSIGYFLNIILGLLGIVLVILLIYAGFLYLTSQGQEDQVKKAKETMKNAVIGIVIVVSAYALSGFVIQAVYCSMSTDVRCLAPDTAPSGGPGDFPTPSGDEASA